MRRMAVVADAALDEREREVLDRLVAALVDEYGADLDAVWLMAHARVASGPCTAPTRTPHDDTSLGVPRRICPRPGTALRKTPTSRGGQSPRRPPAEVGVPGSRRHFADRPVPSGSMTPSSRNRARTLPISESLAPSEASRTSAIVN